MSVTFSSRWVSGSSNARACTLCRGARFPDHGRRHRSRGCLDLGAATCRAVNQSALCAHCGECPVGQSIRCALWHGRNGHAPAKWRVRPRAGRAGDRLGAGVPRSGGAACGGVPIRLRVFVSDYEQSINLHRGVWHGVLTPIGASGRFVVVDRIGDSANLEKHWFDAPYVVETIG